MRKTRFAQVPLGAAWKIAAAERERQEMAELEARVKNSETSPAAGAETNAGGTKIFSPLFDIFRVAAGGAFIWIQSAPTFEAATKRAEELATVAPGEYFVLSQKIVDALALGPDRVDGPPGAHRSAAMEWKQQWTTEN